MQTIYWPSVFFLLFGALSCVFALAVLLSSNIVRMAFYLVLSLASTSGLFFLAGEDFVGAMQLMIYVGGTLVLLIFGVMLTSQERFRQMHTTAGYWIFGFMAGSALLWLLFYAAFSVPQWRGIDRAAAEQLAVEPTAAPAGLALLGVRGDGQPGYLLHFEIVSVHLLVVLIGAAYLARAKMKRAKSA